MFSTARWREHAAVLLIQLIVFGGFVSRVRDPRSSAVRVEPPPTLTPAPTPTATVLSVYVSGAVTRPGVVELPSGARVSDAVRRVGGLSSHAARDHVNLAAPLGDGQQIHVPRRDEVGDRPPDGLVPGGVGRAPAARGAIGDATSPGAFRDLGPGSAGTSAGAGARSAAGGGDVRGANGSALVDINHSSAVVLQSLPGVGPALAARIVAHRETNGPFQSVEGLVDVAGIGPKTLERMRSLVVVR